MDEGGGEVEAEDENKVEGEVRIKIKRSEN